MKKLFIILIIGLVLLTVIQFPHAMISPGELVEGHQKLNNQCLACHKPFGGIANEKCISCHKLSDIGIQTINQKSKPQFHEQLANQQCSSCHSDHQGVKPAFSMRGFKHELLSETIISNCSSCHTKPSNNLHLQTSSNCNTCHQTKSWKQNITFSHDALLNKTNCASCHTKPKDIYHNAIIENCDRCHNTTKWVPSTFNHSAYFVLDKHHNVSCNTCHLNNSYKLYTCYGCHEHTEANTIAEHNEEGIYNISNCVSCHKSGSEHEGSNENEQENGDD